MKTNFLFPSKFRKLAYAILVLIFVFIIIAGQLNLLANEPQIKLLVKSILMSLICLFLFFIQFSKYKDDDEMMLEIRLRLVMNALLSGTLYLIISPILEFFVFDGEIQEIKAGQIIMVLMIYQILMFQMKRYQLKKELNEELH
ncbi:hypothetical protein SAMN02927937_02751 [Paenimyroides aquimaris]|uniref:Uncharacterized protein n=1 Tax=Paenimyroides marinum TaxID=1159016 RepID=A0A1H6MUH9_9FLAO|nr:hypothetical protein [Paenimyroides aquimaris]SEI01630.1 hypothetical protein SAMN02927937_02751 [Paenimyroides aquimaris]